MPNLVHSTNYMVFSSIFTSTIASIFFSAKSSSLNFAGAGGEAVVGFAATCTCGMVLCDDNR